MRRPTEISGKYEKQFWNDYAPELIRLGILNNVTRSAFITLCDVWERLQTVTEDTWRCKYLDHYERLAKSFGIIPHATRVTAAMRSEDNEPSKEDTNLDDLIA